MHIFISGTDIKDKICKYNLEVFKIVDLGNELIVQKSLSLDLYVKPYARISSWHVKSTLEVEKWLEWWKILS